MNNAYSLIILLFNDLRHYSLFTILSFSNFSNQQLCTNLHTSSPTKAKPPGTHARNVVKKTALPYTSMVTHINPSTRKLASVTVLSNVDITIHQNSFIRIIRHILQRRGMPRLIICYHRSQSYQHHLNHPAKSLFLLLRNQPATVAISSGFCANL